MKSFFTLLIIFGTYSSSLFSQTLVKDIVPGSTNSNPATIAYLSGNRTFFYADDGVHGTELWITDGSVTGTRMVADINPSGSSFVDYYGTAILNDKLYFGAYDGTTGFELWVTDGTDTGTRLVKDVSAGSRSGFADNQIITFNNKLYYMGSTINDGTELWCSDGTAAGTNMLKDINPGYGMAFPKNFTLAFGKLFFIANDGTSGDEWWYTDGTVAGTAQLADLFPGSNNGASGPMVVHNGWGYFNGMTDYSKGNELCRTNGTITEMVKDINPLTSSFPFNFVGMGNYVYFVAIDAPTGYYKLWKTDGTATGTTIVKQIDQTKTTTYIHIIGVINNKLLLSALDTNYGVELWVSDGTASGTNMLTDINAGKANGVNTLSSETALRSHYMCMNSPYLFDGYYYFSGNDGINGTELWRTDGTAAGTIRISQIAPGAAGSALNWIFNDNTDLWLTADNGTTGLELYKFTKGNSSVTSIKISSALNIIPNPGLDKITITENGLTTITDMRGVEVMQFENEHQPVDVSKLASGIYIVSVRNNKGVYNTKWLKD